ncbi:uncharacterized protein Z518_02124 [Rhinocladiella mackenziei CBS 650.93]|uniref:Rhinocladiella mackenziei CBS 650.93 unplaced genomic scaffold supercont1.2, whole genome shotgun sequence n=1 Tax=Rhinocladiella mackenziei CBS 650.93 TaxID=1442369 RepID=A0A0D2IW46_9EURO|nr:uncharacterized protein Z518_02124 [Rhinocladiella mackenziei CBS 650.93]KIX07471.1 hypothetical protein Z518_02124 [Rhinocladiella mackenziei CBS 650.93]
MTFGRPTMISHPSEVQPPQSMDDEYLQDGADGVQPRSRESRLAFFVYSIKLFDILDDILSTLYLNKTGSDFPTGHGCSQPQQPLSAVMKLNSDLDRFFNGLPPHLRPGEKSSLDTGPISPRSPCFTLQANVLYCRFLYTRTLLLRPILLTAKKLLRDYRPNAEETSLEHHVVLKACSLCSKTAQLLINSLFDNLQSVFRCSGWYTVYFAFAAATVLICIRLSETPGTICTEEEFQISWDRVIAILRYHEPQIQSARRAVQILESFRHHQTNSAKVDSNFQQGFEDQVDFASLPLPMYNDEFGSINNAWFTQQILSLDFLDII